MGYDAPAWGLGRGTMVPIRVRVVVQWSLYGLPALSEDHTGCREREYTGCREREYTPPIYATHIRHTYVPHICATHIRHTYVPPLNVYATHRPVCATSDLYVPPQTCVCHLLTCMCHLLTCMCHPLASPMPDLYMPPLELHAPPLDNDTCMPPADPCMYAIC